MFSEKQRKKKCLPKTIDSLRNKTYNLVNIKTKETLKETLLLNNDEIFCAGCHGVSFEIKRRKNYETDIITTKT